MTFAINWDPLSIATHGTGATAMIANFAETDMCAAKSAWQVQMDLCGGTAFWTFDGIMTGFEMSSPENEVLQADVSVKVSGQPVLSVS